MAIQRLITDEQGTKLKDIKKYKGRTIASLSAAEKDDLLKIIAEQLNLL